MAFVIHNPPEFTLDVEQWTRQTKANGEQMAKNVIEIGRASCRERV